MFYTILFSILAAQGFILAMYLLGKFFCLEYYYKCRPVVVKFTQNETPLILWGIGTMILMISSFGYALYIQKNGLSLQLLLKPLLYYAIFVNAVYTITLVGTILSAYHESIKIKKGYTLR